MFCSFAAAMKPRTALGASGAPVAPLDAGIPGLGAGVGADEHAARAERANTAVITFLTRTPCDLRPET